MTTEPIVLRSQLLEQHAIEPGDILCRFTVRGRPRPKGNIIRGRSGGYHDATKGLGSWMSIVRTAASAAWVLGEPYQGAVRVDVAFDVPARAADRLRSGLRSGVRPVTRGSGDIDKLARSILDALDGVCYGDDAQVVVLRAVKEFTDDPVGGATVTVRAA